MKTYLLLDKFSNIVFPNENFIAFSRISIEFDSADKLIYSSDLSETKRC